MSSDSIEDTREALLAKIRQRASSEGINPAGVESLARAFALVTSNKPPRSAYEDHDTVIV